MIARHRSAGDHRREPERLGRCARLMRDRSWRSCSSSSSNAAALRLREEIDAGETPGSQSRDEILELVPPEADDVAERRAVSMRVEETDGEMQANTCAVNGSPPRGPSLAAQK